MIKGLSKNKIKYLHSLELKKKRKEDNVFLAEGPKLVGDLLPYLSCKLIAALPEWLANNPQVKADEVIEVTQEELSQASLLKAPQQVLAVFKQPKDIFNLNQIEKDLCLALDDVQDPGNLGTIIRIADWFGITHVFCSQNTVDVFNPKTVQATMGALARVNVHYVALPDFIRTLTTKVPVYGTFLDGGNMYNQPLSTNGIIVMGNEGNGISKEVGSLINRKLYIPNYPESRATSESLNVAIATAVVCAEFRRQVSFQ